MINDSATPSPLTPFGMITELDAFIPVYGVSTLLELVDGALFRLAYKKAQAGHYSPVYDEIGLALSELRIKAIELETEANKNCEDQ